MTLPNCYRCGSQPCVCKDGITLYHGDCRDILPLLEAGSVDLVLTDPPYGVGINYGKNSDDSPDVYWEWFLPILKQIRTVCPKVVLTHRQEAIRHIHGWDHLCAWNKPMAYGYAIHGWLCHWEPIFVFGAQPDIQVNPKRKPARFDVFTFNTAPNKTGHPCPKPMPLVIELVRTFSGDVILDPFAGSGTTGRACKDLGRRCIMVEIEEKYCDIAARRLDQEVLFT